MEQLIFIGVIILFSILDAVARKRRTGEDAGPPVPSPEEWDPIEDPDGDGIPGQPRPEYTSSYGTAGRRESGTSRSSETMVPDEIWKEIEALARGERAPAPEPAPELEPRPESELRPEEAARAGTLPEPVARRVPVRTRDYGPGRRPAHRVHRSHAGYGTDPSSRPSTAVLGAQEALGPEGRRARELLAGGRESLRTAFVLREVLGPPVSMRE